MPVGKFNEWRAFEELDPPSEERIDWGFAHIVQALFSNGKPLRDFMLPFGDRLSEKPTVVQSVQTQEMLLDAWIFANNEAIAAQSKHA